MKKAVLLSAFALLVSASVFAADAEKKPSPAQQAQQQRMKDCNAQAGDKKGDERKAFMSSCLKAGDTTAKKQTPQQEKMGTCNKDASAKGLKGDDRKKFMSECLKG